MGFPVSFIIFIHQLSLGFSEKTHATACLLIRRNLTVTSLISSSGFPADLHFSTATRELLGFTLKYIIRITRKILKLSSYHVKHSHTGLLKSLSLSMTQSDLTLLDAICEALYPGGSVVWWVMILALVNLCICAHTPVPHCFVGKLASVLFYLS